MVVYSRINEIRAKKGITWKYLNENTPGKVYSSRMTELKNGKTTLSNEQLEAIANILETSTDYLLGNTDDPSPPRAEETPTQKGERELPYADLREALSEGGVHILLDADVKLPQEHLEEILEFIKMKQRKYGR